MDDDGSYLPLRAGCIRLLHLEGTTLVEVPGSLNGASDLAVRCRLTVCSFDEIKKGSMCYTALSYTWGSKSFGRWVICNGLKRRVTGNLYNVLLQMTLSGSSENNVPFPLWVDAMCINQDHLEEKSHQVSIMGDIYRAASFVTIWLGSAVEMPGDTLGQFWESAASPSSDYDMNETKLSAGREFLSKCAWFKRAWTFQEFILAKKAVIRCGPFVVDWNVFYNRCKEVESVKLIHEAAMKYQLEAGAVGIMDLLELTGERKATDPRDKVFSLKAMCAQTLPETNYRTPVRSIFSTVSHMIIDQTQDLSILTLLELPVLGSHYVSTALTSEKFDRNYQSRSWNWAVTGCNLRTQLTRGLIPEARKIQDELRSLHSDFSFNVSIQDDFLICRGGVLGQWASMFSPFGTKTSYRGTHGIPTRIPKCMKDLLVGPLKTNQAFGVKNVEFPCSHPGIPEKLKFHDSLEIYQKFWKHGQGICSCLPKNDRTQTDYRGLFGRGLPGTSEDDESSKMEYTAEEGDRYVERPIAWQPKGGWLCYLFGGVTANTLYPELVESGNKLQFTMTGKGRVPAFGAGIAELGINEFQCGCEGFWIPTEFRIR